MKTFATGTFTGRLYFHLLLRFPYHYYSRVGSIFVDAQLSVREIKEIVLRLGAIEGDPQGAQMGAGVPHAYSRLKVRWEQLVETLTEEWKTLNTISLFLLG